MPVAVVSLGPDDEEGEQAGVFFWELKLRWGEMRCLAKSEERERETECKCRQTCKRVIEILL